MTLSISMWNIQGLNSSAFGLKSLNTEFQKSIKEMDIIILQETWSRADAITHCPPNYREIILPSQKLSTVRQGRDSGGQIIWYKSKFHNHINTVKQGKYYTWLKIHKELLSSRKDIFLCAIYIPPSESPYYSEDMFSTLEEETNHFQAQGNVLICGDLNARTGLQPDFTDTQGSKYINNKLTVINNTFSHIHRNNHDHDPNNAEIRHLYCATLKQYKHTLRTKKAQYTQKQLTIIEKSVNTNQFWDTWNNLKKTDHEELPIQNGEIWENHFQTLFNKVQTDTNCEQNQTINQLEKLELTIKDNQNPLDFPITDKELKDKIKNLQLQKASGPDGILNEMIKHTSSKLQLAVLKLFNVILRVGYFPDIWNQGLITPIFKNGDKFDPNNYRGICVSSKLGKLFCSIINA